MMLVKDDTTDLPLPLDDGHNICTQQGFFQLHGENAILELGKTLQRTRSKESISTYWYESVVTGDSEMDWNEAE